MVMRLTKSRQVVLIVSLLILHLPSYGASVAVRATSCTYRYSQEYWPINNHRITVEIYRPSAPGTFPLVFMLHGSAGAYSVKPGEEPRTENFGEKTVAHACFVVVLPHYLEGIGRTSLVSRSEIVMEFSQLFTIADMLLCRAESLPVVKQRPVYLFGDSLGAYLSVALALRRSKVAAVSEISGGLPEGYGLERRGSPRVLISHGATDRIVPLSEASALALYCRAHDIPVGVDVYQGQGHYLSQAMDSQVVIRTIQFFRAENGTHTQSMRATTGNSSH
jgi:acetyl esterase/lipase